MTTFESDRELIVNLSDQNAFFILSLLDSRLDHDKAPSELQETLSAARRIPDVSRYFLVNKAQKFINDTWRRCEGIN